MNENGVKPSFDPSTKLIKLQKKDYLEVKWRILWLRTEHPEATIETTLVEHVRTIIKNTQGIDVLSSQSYAVVRARVTIPGHGSATGLGSEHQGDFNDYLEKAETKAIGRALASLGFGTQFADDHDMVKADGTQALVDSPVAPAAPPKTYNAKW